MSAAHNKKKRGNLFDKIVLRTLLVVLCTIGIVLLVLGRLYAGRHGAGGLLADRRVAEIVLGEWVDIFTPVTVIVALVCVGVAAVLVVMELASLD